MSTASKRMLIITTLLVLAALSIWVAQLYNQHAILRNELVALRAASQESSQRPPENGGAADTNTSREELRRLRREHLELLSLRGRVRQLSKELQQKHRAQDLVNTNPVTNVEEKEPDSILFTASLTNRVPNKHTLVIGGWSKNGMRGYLLAQPVIDGVDAASGQPLLTVNSQTVMAPDTFWDQIGWGSYKSDTRRSTLAGVLTPEDTASLIQALKESQGAEISNASSAKSRDGEPMGFSYVTADEQETGKLIGIDLFPRLAPDGASVDLALSPSPDSPRIPIHSSLRQDSAAK